MILWAACEIAFIPLAQTLLTVVQITVSGKPAYFAACRAGACPRLACSTQPISTSSTWSGCIPALSMADLMAIAPNLVAGTSFNEPP